jgi:elongation factor P--(R)-beta-lysine ligase
MENTCRVSKAINWRPGASIDTLQKRAKILHTIRQFFADRDVMEVETPVFLRGAVTDPNLQSLITLMQLPEEPEPVPVFAHTSPEYAMKRLLAAGSGSIYQLAKVFRNGESGRYHNPEFTLLEWYRLDWSYHQLMDEVCELLDQVVGEKPQRYSMAELLDHYLKLDMMDLSAEKLQAVIQQQGIDVSGIDLSADNLLDYLFDRCIVPHFQDQSFLVYDYPSFSAQLAQLSSASPVVAERFEVYIQGVEIANGYQELQDLAVHQQRFDTHLKSRELSDWPLDEKFLAAIDSGLPRCAGVALGVDRLCMVALNQSSIDAVIAFSAGRV